MYSIQEKYMNVGHATKELLRLAMSYGDLVHVRGSDTMELSPVSITIKNPLERCLIMPARHDNIFHKIAETLWVISGRNDADWLERYLPRALDYSDDGKTWRAGYGKRLRKYGVDNGTWPWGVDQIAECVHLLASDRTTRRATMSIFDPTADYCDSKDIPCNNWISWLIRSVPAGPNSDADKDVLHMSIAQRSSDILWGFSGINVFEWSVLQMMMAYWVGNVGVGYMNYFINSSHVYEKHWKRAEEIVKKYNSTVYDWGVQPTTGFCTNWEDFDVIMRYFWKLEDISYGQPLVAFAEYVPFVDPFLDVCFNMLMVYNIHRVHGFCDQLYELLSSMPDTDFKLAAVDWLVRSAVSKDAGADIWSEIKMDGTLKVAYDHVMHIPGND